MKPRSIKKASPVSWTDFVTPCVSLSFLVAVGPAYANRGDFDRDLVRQMRLEERGMRRQEGRNRIESALQSLPTAGFRAESQPHAMVHTPDVQIRRHDLNLRNNNRTWQMLDSGRIRNANSLVELNLGSGSRDILLGANLFDQGGASVTLTVGGGVKTFAVGDKVTAAEYASILQVVGGAQQSLQIDNQGRAAGGSLTLESLTNGDNMRVSGLVVPESVEVVGNFGARSDFNLTGDLVNNGAVYALSNRAGANKATISAQNILNSASGSISSVIDAAQFSQYGALENSVDLKLKANENLTNNGSIASSGDLTLSAKSIVNQGSNRLSATIAAHNNVNLEADSVVNHLGGAIVSQAGDVNILSPTNGSIEIDSTAGSIVANSGRINVGDAANTAKVNTTLLGGDWLSRELNIYSGDGALKVNVGEVTGAVSAFAGTANIESTAENFNLANLKTSGDPTIKGAGNVTVGDIATDGGPLAVLARGNITFTAGAVIDTSSLTGDGGDIIMVAGSDWQTQGANNRITGASSGGGSIDATGNAIEIYSDGNGDAGDIQLIAFQGNTANSGRIILDQALVTALGGNASDNGNVTIIGGGGVVLDGVDALGIGSNANTGNKLISSFNPVVVNGPVLIDDATGALVQGGFSPNQLPANTFDLSVTNTIFAGAAVAIQGADEVNVSDIDCASLAITSVGDINLSNDITAASGMVIVSGNDIQTVAPGALIDLVTDGGNVYVVAGAAFTQNATNIVVSGASATGGGIDFETVSLRFLDTTSSAPNGSGGDVELIAFDGTDPQTGYIITNGNDTVITTGANGTGANGDFTAIAGYNDFSFGLGIRGSVDTTGSTVPGSGNVYIATAAPLGGVTITKANATRTAGTFKGGAVSTNSDTRIDDITVGAGAAVEIIAGRQVILDEVQGGALSTLSIDSRDSAILNNTINVGQFTLTARTFVEFYGDIFARNGIMMVAGQTITAGTPLLTVSSANNLGDAGNLSLIAGAAFTRSSNSVTVTGASATGGAIFFVTGPVGALNSSSTAPNGSAGDITVVAFEGATTDFGTILFSNTMALNASGNGTGANGDVIMVAGDQNDPVAITLQANVTLSGQAGTGLLSFNAATPNAPVTLSIATSGVASGDFRGGALTSGNIFVGGQTVAGGTIEILTGGAVSAGNLNVSAGAVGNGGTIKIRSGAADTLDVGVVVTTNNIASVNAQGGTTSGNAGTIDIQADGAGGINLQQLGSLSPTDGNGGTLRLATAGTIARGVGVSFNVNAATTTATARDGGSLTLIASNLNNAALSLFGNGVAGGAGGTLTLTSTGSNLVLGAGANEIEIQPGFKDVFLNAAGGTNTIELLSSGGFTANSSITINAPNGLNNQAVISAPVFTINAAPSINNAGTLTGTSALTIVTNSLSNGGVISGGLITVDSTPASGFTLSGTGGSFNATVETIINATTGNMTLSGTQTFDGDVTFNALASLTSTITLLAGSNYVGNDRVEVNTYTFNQFGSISGNPLVINTTGFYTIANGSGNVVLTSDIIINSQNVAIIASGDILASGATTINLSGGALNGGSLTLLAGFDFTPTTLSQVTTAVPLTVTGASATGGDIELSGVTINLSSTSANAGSLVALATGGLNNNGSVFLASVDASSSAGAGNSILMVGQAGVSCGTIVTEGAVADGNVTVAVAVPVISGTIIASNGTIQGGGSFSFGARTSGSIGLAGVDAGDGNISLTGAAGSGDLISNNLLTQLLANNLSVEVGAGTANLRGSVEDLSVSATGAAIVNFNQLASDLDIVAVTGTGLNLNVNAAARIFLPSNPISLGSLSLDAVGAAGVSGIVMDDSVTTSGILNFVSTGDIVVNQNITAGGPVSIDASNNAFVDSPATISGSSVAIAGGNSLAVSGNLSTSALLLESGDDLLMSDLTGTISPLSFLIATSLNGNVGTSVTPFTSNASLVQLTASGGSLFYQSTNTGGVELQGATALGDIVFTSQGPLLVTSNVTTTGGVDGDISLTQTGAGTLAIADGVTITSSEGDITIINQDINKKTGFITIGNNVTIKGSGTTGNVGEVFIVLGAIPTELKFKKPPKNVTINANNGANVYIGKKGLNVKKQTNIVLQALGRNLIFNTDPKQNKKNLSLGSNINITADPPGDVFVPRERRVGSQSFASPLGSGNSLESLGAGASVTYSGSELQSFANLSLAGGNAARSAVLSTETNQLSAYPLSALQMSQTHTAQTSHPSHPYSLALVSDVLPETLPLASGAQLSCDQSAAFAGVHELGLGSALYVPSKPMTVITPHAKVAIAPHSVVLLVTGEHGTSVYDLHDGKRQAVSVEFAGKKLSLSPGRHATVCSRHADSYTDVNPVESILHRAVERLDAAGSAGAFTSEFSILSAVQSVGAFGAILQSSHPNCQKLSRELIKTSAVLMHVSGSREPFQHYLKPCVTASIGN